MDDDFPLSSRLGWEALIDYHSVNGHQIAVASGGGDGPHALLVLHGFPSSSWDFYKQWPALVERSPVIAPDFLGFGLSDKPANHRYSIIEQADICEAILSKRGVTSVDILSHDYGDSVAQEVLARAREGSLSVTIKRVVMLNGGIVPEAYRPRPIQTLLAGPLGPLVSKLLTKARFSKGLAAVFGPDTQPAKAEMNMIWDFYSHKDGHKRSHALLGYLAERSQYRDRWVGAIVDPSIPLRLINGSLDPVSGKHVIDAYLALGGQADIVDLSNVGHYPQIEAPEATLQATLDFLNAP